MKFYFGGVSMEYIYAALLLHSAGKEITEDAVKAILEAFEWVGMPSDSQIEYQSKKGRYL